MRLTDDLIAILTSFSGRLYGMRNHKQKKIAAPIEEELHTS
jgi:putative resolvase